MKNNQIYLTNFNKNSIFIIGEFEMNDNVKQADNRIVNRKKAVYQIENQIDERKNRINDIEDMQDTFASLNKSVNGCLDLLRKAKGPSANYKIDDMYQNNVKIIRKVNNILDEEKVNTRKEINDLYEKRINIFKEERQDDDEQEEEEDKKE